MRVGKPKDAENYHVHDFNGLVVLAHKEIKYSGNVIKIDVRKFLFFHEIYVCDPDTKCFCGGEVF